MCCNLGRLVSLHCSSFYCAKRWLLGRFFVCSRLALSFVLGLNITVCGLAKVAILPLNFHTKHTLQIYEKLSYEALNRHFCQTAVISCPSVCPKCCRVELALNCCTVPVCWLALSFAFFCWSVRWQKSKCECKSVGIRSGVL